MNAEWHKRHVLSRKATHEERLLWHRGHQKQCGCRSIPAKLRERMAPAVVPKKSRATARARKTSGDPGPIDPGFAPVVNAFARDRLVTYGGRGFGSTALKVHGQIFAMLSSKGQFVVKLPRNRVDELVRLGQGEYFDPGHGRLMKAWIAVTAGTGSWVELAREAHAFVKSGDS